MAMTYDEWNAYDLVEALELSGEQPDPALLEALVAHDDAVVPELVRLVEAGVDESWGDDDPRWYRDVHAGLVLIERAEPRMLSLLERIYRDEDKVSTLGHWFNPRLRRYGADVLPVLEPLLDAGDGSHMGRVNAIIALGHLAEDPSLRERVVPLLRSVLPPRQEDGTPDLPADPEDIAYAEVEPWTWAAMGLMHARDAESRDRVLALYDLQVIDDWVLSREEFLDGIDAPDEPAELPSLPDYYEQKQDEEREMREHAEMLRAELQMAEIAEEIRAQTGLPEADVADLMERMMVLAEADEEPDDAQVQQVITEFMADRGIVRGHRIDEEEQRRRHKIGRNERVVIRNMDTGETKTIKFKHAEKQLDKGWTLVGRA